MEERKKTNNNRKITWKAIVAVVLVMASLFAMSSLVNAGIVELILGEEYAEVAAAASEESSGSSEGEDEANECKHEKINSVDSKLRSPCPVCNEDRVVWHLICANENCKKSLGTTIDFHWQH